MGQDPEKGWRAGDMPALPALSCTASPAVGAMSYAVTVLPHRRNSAVLHGGIASFPPMGQTLARQTRGASRHPPNPLGCIFSLLCPLPVAVLHGVHRFIPAMGRVSPVPGHRASGRPPSPLECLSAFLPPCLLQFCMVHRCISAMGSSRPCQAPVRRDGRPAAHWVPFSLPAFVPFAVPHGRIASHFR